jgi:hypothetical protein
MTDLVPAPALDLAKWPDKITAEDAEDAYLRHTASATLAAMHLDPDVEKVLDMFGRAVYSEPVYVGLRREHVKHGKLPAEALPRWHAAEWD